MLFAKANPGCKCHYCRDLPATKPQRATPEATPQPPAPLSALARLQAAADATPEATSATAFARAVGLLLGHSEYHTRQLLQRHGIAVKARLQAGGSDEQKARGATRDAAVRAAYAAAHECDGILRFGAAVAVHLGGTEDGAIQACRRLGLPLKVSRVGRASPRSFAAVAS